MENWNINIFKQLTLDPSLPSIKKYGFFNIVYQLCETAPNVSKPLLK